MKIDVSNIEGTRCYCSDESAEQIRSLVKAMPLEDIHLLGSGDYHYLTLFWSERIEQDFVLLLIDKHSDRQESAFGDILSCGSWVNKVLALPHCKSLLWIDGQGETHGHLEEGLPMYISVDIDALSTDYAHTNWDQGTLSLEFVLKSILKYSEGHNIIGADICGSAADGASANSIKLNDETIRTIEATLRSLLPSNH